MQNDFLFRKHNIHPFNAFSRQASFIFTRGFLSTISKLLICKDCFVFMCFRSLCEHHTQELFKSFCNYIGLTFVRNNSEWKTKCESEFRRGTYTFRSKTTQELQNSRFQDANFPLNTFFRSQLCRITKN
jgi:hypothetical protein